MKRQPRSSARSTKALRTVSIIGTGSYVPEKILTNADLSRMVDTSDDWIITRTGIIFCLEIAQQFITSHTHDTVLVIGAEKLTSITNWTDRNSCVLFGDGAGAAVLRHRGSAHGVISTHIGSDGQYSDILFMPG